MQKFSSFGRKKKTRPKFDIEWLCSKTFNYNLRERFIRGGGGGGGIPTKFDRNGTPFIYQEKGTPCTYSALPG